MTREMQMIEELGKRLMARIEALEKAVAKLQAEAKRPNRALALEGVKPKVKPKAKGKKR